MKDVFLILSVILTIVSVLPYIRDTIKGTTKPNIASWITWTLLTSVATVAEFGGHEYKTGIFTASASLEAFIIVLLGLKYGYAKYTLFDAACQIGSLLGFVLWYFFNTPFAAIITAVGIDFLGVLPTLRHSWITPNEETWQTFCLSGIGGFFALFALTAYNWTSLTYAVYIVIVNIILTCTIILRRRLLNTA